MKHKFLKLLHRRLSRGRCWAAIRLSHRPKPSGRAVHEEIDGLDIGEQHGRRFVLLRQLTSRRAGHTPFVQTGAEASDTGAEAVEPDPRCSWQSHSGRVVPMSGMEVPTTPHSIVDPPSAPHVFCCCQMNCELCGGYKSVSRFELPCVPTEWIDESWVEQMCRLHRTVC